MLLTPAKQQNHDEGPMGSILMASQPFMIIAENDKHNRVEVHLRGEFGSPQSSTKELTELSHLSEKYPTCLVYINSIGGRVDMLNELMAYFGKFQHVITVVTAHAASAGLMLWATGDVRVIEPNAELMAHRESSGFQDKTDALFERAAFLRRRFDIYFKDMFKDILTEEEIEHARRGEVWLLGQDMVDRGVAISWEHFVYHDTMPVQGKSILSRNGKDYMQASNGELLEVTIEIDQSKVVSFLDVMYGIDPPEEISLQDEDVALAPQMATTTDSDQSDSFFIMNHEVVNNQLILEEDYAEAAIAEAEIRRMLRAIFGKGNYCISKGSHWHALKVSVLGKMVELGLFNSKYVLLSDISREQFVSEINRVVAEYEIQLQPYELNQE